MIVRPPDARFSYLQVAVMAFCTYIACTYLQMYLSTYLDRYLSTYDQNWYKSDVSEI